MMPAAKPVFGKETFRFFRDLGRNNNKDWMDRNRDRYKSTVVQPFRKLLEVLSQDLLAMNPDFDVSGRTGPNFSRINRDIRFARDKTIYKTQMYLKFCLPSDGDREAGQLYAALATDTVTAGFRIYAGPKRKESALALIAAPRVALDPGWVAGERKRLRRKYDSYWYSTIKGEWTKHQGWPTNVEHWQKIQAWVVRKKMKPAAATRAAFPAELRKIFRELYPLLKFTSIAGRTGG